MIRTTRPTSGNKYFITKSAGGYSTCIVGITKKSSAEPTRDTKNRYSITSTFEVKIEEV